MPKRTANKKHEPVALVNIFLERTGENMRLAPGPGADIRTRLLTLNIRNCPVFYQLREDPAGLKQVLEEQAGNVLNHFSLPSSSLFYKRIDHNVLAEVFLWARRFHEYYSRFPEPKWARTFYEIFLHILKFLSGSSSPYIMPGRDRFLASRMKKEFPFVEENVVITPVLLNIRFHGFLRVVNFFAHRFLDIATASTTDEWIAALERGFPAVFWDAKVAALVFGRDEREREYGPSCFGLAALRPVQGILLFKQKRKKYLAFVREKLYTDRGIRVVPEGGELLPEYLPVFWEACLSGAPALLESHLAVVGLDSFGTGNAAYNQNMLEFLHLHIR